MKKIVFFLLFSLIFSFGSFAQTYKEQSGKAAKPYYKYGLKIGHTGAMERGVIRFNTNDSTFSGYNGTEWISLSSSTDKVTDLNYDTLAGIANEYRGTTIQMTAGETLAFGNVCYLKSDGKIYKADASAESTTFSAEYLCLETLIADQTGKFLLEGYATTSDETDASGQTLYLSETAGSYSNTTPTTPTAYIKNLGYTLGGGKIRFNPTPYYELNNVYDYYVSTTGNDGNDGLSPDTPKLTIGAAEALMSGAKKCWVESGTYEFAAATFSGGLWYSNGAIMKSNTTGTNFITLDGTTAVKYFNGFTFDRNSTGASTIYLSQSTANNYFINCKFINSSTNTFSTNSLGSLDISFIQCDIEGGSGSVGIFYTSTVSFDLCSFTNVLGSGIYKVVEDGNLSITNSPVFEIGGGYGVFIRTAGTHTIKGNTITTTANYDGIMQESSITGTMNLIFEDNNITISNTCTYSDIDLTAARLEDVSIRNNTITKADATTNKYIISVVPKNSVTITGNTITHNCLKTDNTGQIYVMSNGDPISANISYNTIYAKNENGYNIDVGTESTGALNDLISATINSNVITSAYFYDNSCTGFVHAIHTGFITDFDLENNKIYGAGMAFGLEHDGSSHNGSVSGNEFYDCLIAYRVKGISDYSATNEIIHASKPYITRLISVNEQLAGEYSLNFSFKNSILYQYGTTTNLINWVSIGVDNTGVELDYNTVYGVNDNPVYTIYDTSYDGWAAIQGAGYETNGSNTNPY